MRYVYIITNEYDYEGNSFVDIVSSKKEAIEIAEKFLYGDNTLVTKYTINSANSSDHRGPEIVANWKQSRGKYKRVQ